MVNMSNVTTSGRVGNADSAVLHTDSADRPTSVAATSEKPDPVPALPRPTSPQKSEVTGAPGPHTKRVLVVLAVLVAVIVAAPTAMSPVARLCLAAFAVMLGLTAFTKLNEVAICSASLLALVAIGGSSVADVTTSFASPTVWLLVGAFVVAAGAKRSGVAERMAFAIGRGAVTVDGLLFRITVALIATAFIVPSTSGRAALMLPVYLAFAERINDRRVRRALAVLFPSAILLSAVASLFGAGAHLVTVELAAASGGRPLGFLEWAVYGLPFAVVSSLVALAVVRSTFLDRTTRAQPVDLRRAAAPWSREERIITAVLGALMVLWLTEGWHPIPAWVAALAGAVVVIAGPLRVVSLPQARAALPLDLLFVMIATAEAGAALARSGAADWVASTLLSPVVGVGSGALAVVMVVGLVSLLAHLVITSRTARASVLIPVVVLVAGAGGLDVTALAFLSTTAAGYCLTTTTSAKPIRVYATVDDGYDEADLRRLSLRLLPLHVLLLLGFAFVIWPILGLALDRDEAGLAGADISYPWQALVVEDLGVGPRIESSPVEATPIPGPNRLDDAPAEPAEPADGRGLGITNGSTVDSEDRSGVGGPGDTSGVDGLNEDARFDDSDDKDDLSQFDSGDDERGLSGTDDDLDDRSNTGDEHDQGVVAPPTSELEGQNEADGEPDDDVNPVDPPAATTPDPAPAPVPVETDDGDDDAGDDERDDD